MRVLIIGCGRVGSRLAASLHRRGHGVTVVDRDPAALRRLPSAVSAARVEGDAADEEVLLGAGVTSTDGLAAVTGSDELNAVIGRAAATRFRVPHVVARIYDPAKAEIYRRLGVQTIAPITWAADRLTELLTHSDLAPVASIGTGEVELVDVRVPALLAGRPVAELTIAGDTQVIAITRRGHTSLGVSPTTVLESGDLLHIAAASTTRLEPLVGME